MGELTEVAAALCDADQTWEHHDQTDDHPCSRCKRYAEAAADEVAAHVARATADAEIVRAEWERQYGYAIEAAERFRKQAADTEARLGAVEKVEKRWTEVLAEVLADSPSSIITDRSVSTLDTCLTELRAALDPAPTTDADGHDERRDGAGGHKCGRDFNASCSGCVTAMSDAYGSDRSRWGQG